MMQLYQFWRYLWRFPIFPCDEKVYCSRRRLCATCMVFFGTSPPALGYILLLCLVSYVRTLFIIPSVGSIRQYCYFVIYPTSYYLLHRLLFPTRNLFTIPSIRNMCNALSFSGICTPETVSALS